MSAVNGTNGSSKGPAKPKRVSRLKDFLALGKEIFNEKEVGDYDQLLSQKNELEQQLQLKTQELDKKSEELSIFQSVKEEEIKSLEANTAKTIAELESSTAAKILELESTNKHLFDEFEKRIVSLDTGKKKQTDLDNKLAAVRKKLTEANKTVDTSKARIASLEEQLAESYNALETTEEDLKATKKDLASKARELNGTISVLDSTQAELETQRRDLGLEIPHSNELATKFRGLGVECHNIAKKFFFTQLPQNLLSNEFWKELESSGFIRAAPKKMPFSNSNAAQSLRMATAEKIIAEKLCANIFKQYYLPYLSHDRKVMDDVLERLDENAPFKEAVFRLQLLAAYEPDEKDFLHLLVESTVKEIIVLLNPLLFSKGARDDFQSALTTLFNDAVKLWRAVQKSETKGWVSNDPEYRGSNSSLEDDIWEVNKEYDNSVELTEDQMASVPEAEPIASLFPQLFLGEDILCHGCALWSDQNTIIAASIEYGQQSPRNPALGRGMLLRRDSNRQRLSFGSSSSVGRRLEERSTSPRSQSGGQTFLDHANSRAGRKISLPGVPMGESGGDADADGG